MFIRSRGIAFVLFLSAAKFAPAAVAPPTFDAWSDAFTADWVRKDPALATYTQYFSGAEQDTLDRRLILSYGRKAAAEKAALARRGLTELKGFSRAEMTPTQRASAALLQWTLQNVVDESAFPLHDLMFNQMSGLHLELVNFLTKMHPIRNRRDVENYLVRLALVPGVIDEGIVEARAAADAGMLPPRFIAQRVIEQLDGFLRQKPRENILTSELDKKVAKSSVP